LKSLGTHTSAQDVVTFIIISLNFVVIVALILVPIRKTDSNPSLVLWNVSFKETKIV
jgi:hypothetical protein